jgi:hypothetical protein
MLPETGSFDDLITGANPRDKRVTVLGWACLQMTHFGNLMPAIYQLEQPYLGGPYGHSVHAEGNMRSLQRARS